MRILALVAGVLILANSSMAMALECQNPPDRRIQFTITKGTPELKQQTQAICEGEYRATGGGLRTISILGDFPQNIAREDFVLTMESWPGDDKTWVCSASFRKGVRLPTRPRGFDWVPLPDNFEAKFHCFVQCCK